MVKGMNELKIMKCLKKESIYLFFAIGALLGAVLFLLIYGFGVLDVTNDSWLVTGKDLQQHYVGWKFFRNAEWMFPLGVHDGITHPYAISVLYTDSIPLFAIPFKVLSPILPETFQYFGLFGLMCYMLNGGVAAVLLAKISRSKLFCAVGSVFFILATPVLQRMFGLITEDSRHTSLAAHFLVLGALGIWMYHNKFKKRWHAALAYSILGVLCVLIQMYFIFIVGGIMCGYLLYELIDKKDWKRCLLVLFSFIASSFAVFVLVGGINDIVNSGGNGYGLYSANLNALVNPYHYSSFFDELPWGFGQYEGMAYLGLGIFVLYGLCAVLFVRKLIIIRNSEVVRQKIGQYWKKYKTAVISLCVISIVFSALAFSHSVFWGQRIVVQVFLPVKWLDLLAIVRSSGRFMWVIMYLLMLLGLFLMSRLVSNKRWQKVFVIVCVCVQLADLAKPISNIHEQFMTEQPEEDIYVKDAFWTTGLGKFKHIVCCPFDASNMYQMLQVGTHASDFDMDMNYFYLSRYYTDELKKKENKKNRKLFQNNQLADDTLYLVDYKIAHKYKGQYYFYEADNLILASKNPIEGLKRYNDVYVSAQEPEYSMEFSYNGQGRHFAHRGWNQPDYGEDGMWTTEQSVVRIYSGGVNRARIRIEYEAGEKGKGETIVKVNGKKKIQIDNTKSGVAEFETNLRETINPSKANYVNWLFLNTDKVFKEKQKNGDIEEHGLYIKRITVTYIE